MNSLTFETDVSDNYKLIRTMLGSTFAKILKKYFFVLKSLKKN